LFPKGSALFLNTANKHRICRKFRKYLINN
jgi:hypothetical protein